MFKKILKLSAIIILVVILITLAIADRDTLYFFANALGFLIIFPVMLLSDFIISVLPFEIRRHIEFSGIFDSDFEWSLSRFIVLVIMAALIGIIYRKTRNKKLFWAGLATFLLISLILFFMMLRFLASP